MTTLYPLLPVLIADDEQPVLQTCRIALQASGISNLIVCQDARDVIPNMDRQKIGVLLLDLMMPHVSGEAILTQAIRDYPEIPVIMITGNNDIQNAVQCMREGAFDYLVKPVERSRLISSVRRAIELRELQHENAVLQQSMLRDQIEHPEAFSEIITGNRKMRVVFQYIEAVAATIQPVLISGETGVGKELVSRTLHRLSGRAGVFVPVNVSGLDDPLFADTLFGHARGAFTGADKVRAGLVEQASTGTLFLDEIGDLTPASQIKLLRLIQEREYFPLGSDLAKQSDARIVVATNRNLTEIQYTGQFRKDLYYRLQTHHIQLPPLRERRDDLPLLIDHFMDKAAKALNKTKPTYPRELISLLSTYSFPGNVRELETMIFDAVSRHSSRILSLDPFKQHIDRHNPVLLTGGAAGIRADNPFTNLVTLPSLDDNRQLLIEEALRRSNHNQTIAARLLGISQQALSKRLKKDLKNNSPGIA